MWSEGNALAYNNPVLLGAGSYGVAMAVTASDGRRIAVKMIPKRASFAPTSDGRIQFVSRELEVMDKMRAANALNVMCYSNGFVHSHLFDECKAIRDETVAKTYLGKFILDAFHKDLHHIKLVFCIEMELAQGSMRQFLELCGQSRDSTASVPRSAFVSVLFLMRY